MSMPSGSNGANHGASAEPARRIATTTTPKNASRWRRNLLNGPSLRGASTRTSSTRASAMKLHSRIDQSDENVGEQIPEHDHDRAHHQDRHQDRIVPGI